MLADRDWQLGGKFRNTAFNEYLLLFITVTGVLL